MILATVRSRLTREDAHLALTCLAATDADAADAADAAMREEGLDAVLDHPALLPALLRTRVGARASSALFCYVLVRHALVRSGERDRLLADLVAAVLVEFGVRDRAQRIAAYDDDRFDTLAELSAAMDGPDPRRAFLARQHLGHYALWLSGLFPDWVEHRRWRRGGPDLDYYETMGRRGYEAAAEHRLAQEHGVAALFGQAAERFAVLRQALNRVSDEVLFPHHHTPERLMRQVRDEGRWKQRG